MFYEPRNKDHGLPHDPFTAIVTPRPIGWITSISAKGEVNLAPYSFFNSVSSDPPIVMFASDGRKHTIDFVEQTREFVCNLATWDLRDQVKETSWQYARGTDEMTAAGLTAAPSRLVKPPRVAASPCALECRLLEILQLTDLDGRPSPRFIAFGQVVGVHIDDRYLKDGLLDTAAMRPIARAGYQEYFVSTSETRFTLRFAKTDRPETDRSGDHRFTKE
jgi:flavin reductase (DIM6/NTAB) family NADH-FMN oxidoreductase RutF